MPSCYSNHTSIYIYAYGYFILILSQPQIKPAKLMLSSNYI